MLREYAVLALSILATVASQEPLDQSPKEESSKKYILPAGPPIQYSPEYYPSNGNEFQFNYVPNKEFYPGGQPPIFVYGGAGVPGQQFLYRPGSPPGNFLIPQPGPGVMFGQPQPPVFNAGYPKPAHIPPIEKDAEEVPNLAGNHHPTRTGRPDATAPYPVGPEKIETLDETVSGEEVDDLAQAEKTPNNYPKKVFPPRPVLRPGQQFFILNGNTLFSNVPLEQDTLNQRNQKAIPIPNYYPLYQPHFIHQPELGASQVQEAKKESGNYVSLNNIADFRQDLFLRQQIPYIAEQPQVPLQAFEVPNVEGLRLPKNLQYDPNYSTLAYPYFVAYDYKPKEDEDTVTIEAKPEETNKRLKVSETSSEVISDEPSISQVKPSALAVAGLGGTSSANPRGTALVGNNGIAVASPEATAVAGPPKEETEQQKPKKEKESA